jgi:hypothetical protein
MTHFDGLLKSRHQALPLGYLHIVCLLIARYNEPGSTYIDYIGDETPTTKHRASLEEVKALALSLPDVSSIPPM